MSEAKKPHEKCIMGLSTVCLLCHKFVVKTQNLKSGSTISRCSKGYWVGGKLWNRLCEDRI